MRPRIGLTTVFKHGDHNDKCTRRYQMALNVAYIDAVRRAGGLPVALPHCDEPEEIGLLLDVVDGIILTGGADILPQRLGQPQHPHAKPMHRRRDTVEFEVLAQAQARRMPVLGICLGCQVVNVARGGSLHQHLYDAPRQLDLAHNDQPEEYVHEVTISPESRLAGIIGGTRITTNSRHHQALDRLGQDLVATARADDGLIEAVEDPQYPFLVAVQWHPEDLTDRPEHLALFQAVVAAAKNNRC